MFQSDLLVPRTSLSKNKSIRCQEMNLLGDRLDRDSQYSSQIKSLFLKWQFFSFLLKRRRSARDRFSHCELSDVNYYWNCKDKASVYYWARIIWTSVFTSQCFQNSPSWHAPSEKWETWSKQQQNQHLSRNSSKKKTLKLFASFRLMQTEKEKNRQWQFIVSSFIKSGLVIFFPRP